MFENLRVDLRQARKMNVGPDWVNQHIKVLLLPTTIAVVVYRFGRWVRRFRIPVLRHLLLPISAFVEYFVEGILGIRISPRAEIGPGFVVHTAFGIFIGPVKIGCNCVVNHGVVISYGVRGVGDDVFLGPGAKVIGNAKIGSNVLVMANSLVITDVPDDTTVVGVPARIRLPRGGTLNFRERHEGGNGFDAKVSKNFVSTT